MDPETRAAYEAHRGVDRKAFPSSCYAPFTSLYLNTNGDVISCCKNTSYVLGNIATESLDEIWHGKRVKALRKALTQYRFGLGCEFCEWQIQGGDLDQVYTRTFDDLPLRGEEPEWPSMLEFAISNTCNLACVMCYGELSSTIRALRENLPPLPKVYGDPFFEDLRKFLPHLTMAKFFGGEPFLAQETHRVWDMMIEDGVQIPCHVTTNGTQWNQKVERVLDHLPVSLSISVDGATKATAESIRVNMNFETVTQNVQRFLDYTRRRHTYLSLTYCLMRQNWHEFGDYLLYGEDLGVDVFINTVIDPSDCSLYTLPPNELSQIAVHMEAQERKHRFSQLPRNGPRWTSAIEALRHHANEQQQAGVAAVKNAHKKRNELHRPDHLSKAWELIFAGEPAKALEEIRKVPADHKKAYEAAVIESRTLRDLNRLDEAEAALARAIDMWRKAPNAFVERAWVRLAQDRPKDALADGRHAESLLSGSAAKGVAPAVHHVLSAALSRLGDHAGALEHANVLIESQPQAVFYIHRAYVHEHMGRFGDMEVDVNLALELEPDNGEAMRLLERTRTNKPRPA